MNPWRLAAIQCAMGIAMVAIAFIVPGPPDLSTENRVPTNTLGTRHPALGTERPSLGAEEANRLDRHIGAVANALMREIRRRELLQARYNRLELEFALSRPGKPQGIEILPDPRRPQ